MNNYIYFIYGALILLSFICYRLLFDIYAHLNKIVTVFIQCHNRGIPFSIWLNADNESENEILMDKRKRIISEIFTKERIQTIIIVSSIEAVLTTIIITRYVIS